MPTDGNRVSRGPDGENRNKLTTDATARLLAEIVTGKAVTPARSAQMMELLKRDYSGTSTDNDDQGHGFTGIALQEIAGRALVVEGRLDQHHPTRRCLH